MSAIWNGFLKDACRQRQVVAGTHCRRTSAVWRSAATGRFRATGSGARGPALDPERAHRLCDSVPQSRPSIARIEFKSAGPDSWRRSRGGLSVEALMTISVFDSVSTGSGHFGRARPSQRPIMCSANAGRRPGVPAASWGRNRQRWDGPCGPQVPPWWRRPSAA
jgi:hypothetical protein